MEWWLAVVKDGGGIAAVLELGALIWLHADRNRLLAELKIKDEKLDSMAERLIVVATELKTFLFSERKS